MKSAEMMVTGSSVLLVDDDDDFRHDMRRMLVSNGLGLVETANSGVAALERLEQGGIAVVLLDMVMPGISGVELLGILVERYPALPVIMITAVSDIKTVVNCVKTGAFDYLTKPLDAGRLFARRVHFERVLALLRQVGLDVLGFLFSQDAFAHERVDQSF